LNTVKFYDKVNAKSGKAQDGRNINIFDKKKPYGNLTEKARW